MREHVCGRLGETSAVCPHCELVRMNDRATRRDDALEAAHARIVELEASLRRWQDGDADRERLRSDGRNRSDARARDEKGDTGDMSKPTPGEELAAEMMRQEFERPTSRSASSGPRSPSISRGKPRWLRGFGT